jgi:Ribonuclease G/E
MQSAFVDLGLERDGFLYVADVVATFEEFDRLETDEDEPGNGGSKGGWCGRRPRRPAGQGKGSRAEDRRAG